MRLKGTFSDGGFDYFGRLEGLQKQLSLLLNCKVDLVEEPASKERCLERISEAAAKVDHLAPVIMPDQPSVRSETSCATAMTIISLDRIWEIVQRDLPTLVIACEDALHRMQAKKLP